MDKRELSWLQRETPEIVKWETEGRKWDGNGYNVEMQRKTDS